MASSDDRFKSEVDSRASFGIHAVMERVGETEISSVGAEGASFGEVVDAVVDERDLFNCVVDKGIFVLIARVQGPDSEVAITRNDAVTKAERLLGRHGECGKVAWNQRE